MLLSPGLSFTSDQLTDVALPIYIIGQITVFPFLKPDSSDWFSCVLSDLIPFWNVLGLYDLPPNVIHFNRENMQKIGSR